MTILRSLRSHQDDNPMLGCSHQDDSSMLGCSHQDDSPARDLRSHQDDMVARSTSSISTLPSSIVILPTLGERSNRRAPAAPGFTTHRAPARVMSGLCVCPYTMTSAL